MRITLHKTYYPMVKILRLPAPKPYTSTPLCRSCGKPSGESMCQSCERITHAWGVIRSRQAFGFYEPRTNQRRKRLKAFKAENYNRPVPIE